jgi:hypothetical protein
MLYHPITFTIRTYASRSGVGCCILQISHRCHRWPVLWYSLWYSVHHPGFSMFSACGVHTEMTVHSQLKSFSFVKLIHYCTEKYLCVHLSQVHVDKYVAWIWAAFPYYVLGCDFSVVRCSGVRYLLGCATGHLWWFLLTTYPETMPPRIPVFSHSLISV